MSQLGERLRAAREAQGISVAQAAADTRILPRYIVALEDGDYQHLPGDVYARGFIRNYAGYLGAPIEELIEIYRQERGMSEPIKIVSTSSTPRIRGLFVPSFFGVFFVVLALVGVSYLLLNLTNNLNSGQQLAEVPQATSAPTPQPLPTWDATATIPDAIAAASTPLPQSASGPTATSDTIAGGAAPTPQPSATTGVPAAPIVGSVRIAPGDHKGSWVRVSADRKVIFEGVLPAGSLRDFTAQNNILIRAGNAGVVYVTINGVEQGPLGAVGDVFDFPWPPQ